MRETWYVLEDGSIADPATVSIGSDGVLRHASGIAVAMRGGVPHSRGVDDPAAERAKARPLTDGAKDMKPAVSRRPYKTRESKIAE